VTIAVVTGLLAYQLPTLRQDEDLLQFLPANDPDIQLFRRVSANFGGLDVAIVGVESPRLLTIEGMEAVRRMTRAAAGVEGVYHTLSFTEVPHLTSTEEEFSIDPIVPEHLPRDRESIEEIREIALHDPLVIGQLLSEDGRAALILCFLAADVNQTAVAAEIKTTVTAEAGRMRLYFGGLPFVQYHIGGGTRRDITSLTPYVLLFAAFATFIFFRGIWGSLLVMVAVGIATIWTIGGMAAMESPMTVISTSLPMVLVAIGGAFSAHVLAAYYVARAPTATERVEIAVRDVAGPVIMSAMAAMLGFASYLTMDVAPMRSFGFTASVGVLLAGFMALVVVPAVLSFSKRQSKPPPAERLGAPLMALAVACRRHRWVTFGVALAVTAVAGSTAWSVASDTSIDSFFRPDSPQAQSDRFLRERFGGSTYVQVFMSSDLRDPVVLDELRSVVEEAQTLEGVSHVSSFLSTLETLAGGFGGVPRLPRTREQVAGLGAFMAGNQALRQLVDDDLTRSIVQITVGSQDTRVVGPMVDDLRAFIEHEIPERIVAVDVHGAGPRVAAARARRLERVSKRVVRLLRVEGETPSRGAEKAVHGVLRRQFGSWTLTPGPDLEKAVVDRVQSFFNSDDSPFDPFEARAAGVALAGLATAPVTAERLAKVLPATLPPEVASDAEGVEMIVPALVDRVSEARAAVVAERCLREVLAAAGASRADGDATTAVRRALEELDDATVGLPVRGREGIAIEMGVTGTPVINRAFGRSVERNQLSSIVTSALTLLILGIAMLRSLRLGAILIFPAMFTLLINFGIMGWLNVPLDPGTCMVASLALGVGIDYAIHYLWRRRWRGMSMEETATRIGPRIVFNAVQVSICFAVMIVADTVPLSNFGILVTVAMAVAAVLSLTLLPAFERRESPDASPADGARAS
jgi:predicted RND superfamily exporter protein